MDDELIYGCHLCICTAARHRGRDHGASNTIVEVLPADQRNHDYAAACADSCSNRLARIRATANTDDIAGGYAKGSVYGPYLSTRELKEVIPITMAATENHRTDSTGIIVFGPLYALSPFMLVRRALAQMPAAPVVDIPKTGNARSPMGYAILALAELEVMAVLLKKRRKQA